MLRFCEEGNLVDMVFDVIVSPSMTGYAVRVNQVYPKEQCDPSIMKSIQVFVFPDVAAIESRGFFNFVLGDTAVDYSHGYVQYFDSFNGRCIISKYFYPDLYKKLLNMEKNEALQLYEKLKVTKGQNSIDISGINFLLDGSQIIQDLYGMIFRTFSPFDVSKLIIGLLEARHIFPISGNASKLCRYAAAFPLLIKPFRWNMNTIPVLPTQLRDVTNVPVPTIIGLTHAEILLEGRVDSHIIANIDTGHILEVPQFEMSESMRMAVLDLQFAFHTKVSNELKKWSGLKTFPHKHIMRIVRMFIADYLMIHTGRFASSDEFMKNLSKLPEVLEDSQVMHDLLHLDSAPKNLQEDIKLWFGEVFEGKFALVPPTAQTVASQKQSPLPPKSASSNLIDFFDAPPQPQPSPDQRRSIQPSQSQSEVKQVDDLFSPLAQAPLPQEDIFDPFAGVQRRRLEQSSSLDLLSPTSAPLTSAAPVDDLMGFEPAPPRRALGDSKKRSTMSTDSLAVARALPPQQPQPPQTPQARRGDLVDLFGDSFGSGNGTVQVFGSGNGIPQGFGSGNGIAKPSVFDPFGTAAFAPRAPSPNKQTPPQTDDLLLGF